MTPELRIKTTVWKAGIDAAHKYLKAYREPSLTNSQIVAAITADALALRYSPEESAEVAESGFKFLERNHYTMRAD